MDQFLPDFQVRIHNIIVYFSFLSQQRRKDNFKINTHILIGDMFYSETNVTSI